MYVTLHDKRCKVDISVHRSGHIPRIPERAAARLVTDNMWILSTFYRIVSREDNTLHSSCYHITSSLVMTSQNSENSGLGKFGGLEWIYLSTILILYIIRYYVRLPILLNLHYFTMVMVSTIRLKGKFSKF